MKNNFLITLFLMFCSSQLFAEDIFIEAKSITLDKNTEITIFKNEVLVKTPDKVITSDFATYNKKSGDLILKNNIFAKDNFNNTIKTEYAEYNKNDKVFKTTGLTVIKTSENYILEGEDIFADNKNKFIKSSKNSVLIDQDGNTINLENFEYLADKNIFKSIGRIEVEDKMKNTYEFSQIYIDTKKKEMLGTDIKALINYKGFKINEKNNPRIFANTVKMDEQTSTFNKSIFTLCEFKKNERCPPWTIQASKMLHDNKSKTIYYDNAVIKVYNIPVFYSPKLSHPDPSVDRRSGFMPPVFSSSKSLGSGISVPYFFAVDKDKNFTLTNRLFIDEHPLFLGEYHQAFKNSNLLTDFGFTQGFKKTSTKKKAGNKSHFFTKFTKNFGGKSDSDNSLSVSIQNVSDDKFFKLYKLKSNLVNYNIDILESSLNFTHQKDDLFFGAKTSIYETLKDNYNDKYEYILPEIVIDKNLISDEKLGNLDLQTNFTTHNYDTNKLTSFLMNEFNWNSNSKIFNSIFKNQFLGTVKNINYEAKNIDNNDLTGLYYKEDTQSELFGAIGLLTEMDFRKDLGSSTHLFTPKTLIKFAPGSMRKEHSGSKLDPVNAYNLNRLSDVTSYETGNTATLGFNYNIKNDNTEKFNFSVAQIINEKEDKKFDSITSMDEKLSDLVGTSDYSINKNLKLKYDFSVDQNYRDLNFTDIGANYTSNKFDIDFNYIQENKHIGNQDYFKTKVGYRRKDSGLFTYETKRDLITDSFEYYNLSYEYINDCLKAGLVYRREFYNDSEIEPGNSLMFQITLTPFGEISTPKLGQ